VREVRPGCGVIQWKDIKRGRVPGRQLPRQGLDGGRRYVDAPEGDTFVFLFGRLQPCVPVLGRGPEINFMDRDALVLPVNFVDVQRRAVVVVMAPGDSVPPSLGHLVF